VYKRQLMHIVPTFSIEEESDLRCVLNLELALGL